MTITTRDRFKEHEDYDREFERKKQENTRMVDSYLSVKAMMDSFDPNMDYHDEQKNEIAKSLPEDFESLLTALRDYIKSADDHEVASKASKGEVSETVMDRLEEESRYRTAAHNLLMFQLNTFGFYLNKLGIDNPIMRAIIGEDGKIDPKRETHRRAVEVWAREVGTYLATVSETTK